MNLNQAQNKVKEIFKDIEHPRLASYIALTEEVGELANEIMKKEIYHETNNIEDLKSELSDVLVCILELANLYDINLSTELNDKFKKLKPRADKWRNDIKDLMSLKRQKLD